MERPCPQIGFSVGTTDSDGAPPVDLNSALRKTTLVKYTRNDRALPYREAWNCYVPRCDIVLYKYYTTYVSASL